MSSRLSKRSRKEFSAGPFSLGSMWRSSSGLASEITRMRAFRKAREANKDRTAEGSNAAAIASVNCFRVGRSEFDSLHSGHRRDSSFDFTNQLLPQTSQGRLMEPMAAIVPPLRIEPVSNPVCTAQSCERFLPLESRPSRHPSCDDS